GDGARIVRRPGGRREPRSGRPPGKTPRRGRAMQELEREIAERRKAEDALRRANAELEAQVQARTRELAEANRALRQDVEDRGPAACAGWRRRGAASTTAAGRCAWKASYWI